MIVCFCTEGSGFGSLQSSLAIAFVIRFGSRGTFLSGVECRADDVIQTRQQNRSTATTRILRQSVNGHSLEESVGLQFVVAKL